MARRRRSSGGNAAAAIFLVPILAIGGIASLFTGKSAVPPAPTPAVQASAAPIPFSAPITPAVAHEAPAPTAQTQRSIRPTSLPPEISQGGRHKRGKELVPGVAVEEQLADHGRYVNAFGEEVHRPSKRTGGGVPDGATARCGDGTYSFSHHRSGTCSRHGGAVAWLR